VSHTCEATFGVPGRGGKGRGSARESGKRGVATDARGLSAFQVLDEIAPPARQVGVNHGAALGEQPTDAARGQVSQHRSQLDIPCGADHLDTGKPAGRQPGALR
jgi:hypothetical protein